MSAAVAISRETAEPVNDEEGIPPQHTFATVLPRWWFITKLWLTGNEKWKARGYIAASVSLTSLYTLLLVHVSYAQRDLSTAMSEGNTAAFYMSVWKFVVIICIAAPLFALVAFVESRLALAWRVYLAEKLLATYFGNKTFFLMNAHADRVDNPDQRICDDIQSFVSTSVLLTMSLFRKMLNCIAFTGVLWGISPKMVAFLLLYSIGGTVFTARIFGKPLMKINFRVLHREGDLRYALIRVRENAESIAFYDGQVQEKANASRKFDRIIDTRITKINWLSGLEVWKNIYSFATILIPSLLTAPRYFAGEVEFGVIAQATYAFNRMNEALAALVNNFSDISGLSAQTERIVTLMDLMEKIEEETMTSSGKKGTKIQRSIAQQPNVLRIDQLNFKTPGGGQIITNAQDLVLQEGESLLVMGPSGCGKSSLLRVLCGLWMHGKGSVALPLDSNVFFLPQKPYMPLGTFRHQLLFPQSNTESVMDSKLEKLLEEVQLGHVLERVGGFDVIIDWAQVLSLGEQQRVAFLRLFLASPYFAVLDEATSALDVATERLLYTRLKTLCPSFISVGHRVQLMEYHTHILEYEGNGVWTKKRVSDIADKEDIRPRQNLLLG